MRIPGLQRSALASLCLLVFFQSGCQTNSVSSGTGREIREVMQEYREAVNQHSDSRLFALLAGEIRVEGMTDELSRAGLKAGLAWTPSRITDLQILSISRKDTGSEVKAAFYMPGSVLILRFGLDDNLRIRTIDPVPWEKSPEAKVSSVFTSAFKENNGLMFVRATVNGQTGFFLLDTGSSDLLLNKKHFSPDSRKEMPGMTATVRGIQPFLGRSPVRSFQWGNLHAENLRGQLHDFSVMETPAISPLLGAIGYEQLKNSSLLFDWKNKIIRVAPSVREKPSPVTILPVPPKTVIPFTYFLHTPSFPVQIGGKSCPVIFDSGAQINLLPKLDGIEDHFHRIEAVTRISDGAKIGRETALLGLVDETVIGGLRCKDQPFAIFEVPYLAGHGILGSPLLQTHLLEIDFARKTLSLW